MFLTSCAVAPDPPGFSSSHTSVFWGSMLQETWHKVRRATNHKLVLSASVARVGTSKGNMLFGSEDLGVDAQPLPSA